MKQNFEKQIDLRFLQILKEELKPAMGCTEPISIAYASSKARSLMKDDPTLIKVEISGNILKNVKSVVVPNTGGMRGIEPSIAAGILFGESSKELEVISNASMEKINKINSFLKKVKFEISRINSCFGFDILIHLINDDEKASVRIVDNHMNIVSIKYNNQIIYEKELQSSKISGLTDHSILTVRKIFDFANYIELDKVKDLLDYQIACNMAIAKEGLNNPYGANIGKVILKNSNDLRSIAKAYAAAASDARMSGCSMPVVINSGSGNQGITSSVPVIIYAKKLNYDQESMYRALTLANLITIHLKSGIGRLSAYCGATSAGCGAGAGIAYLLTKDYQAVCHTITNALGILSGMVCDGAKASCAAKVSYAIDAGILGYEMYASGNDFHGGDGLVNYDVENTILNIDLLASEGMIETDKKIIDIMLKNNKE